MSKSSLPQIVQEWAATFTRTGTQGLYIGILGHYYQSYLAPKYGSIKLWVAKIIKGQRRRNTRAKWAVELKNYLDTYVSERTNAPLSWSAKSLLVSAVKSFVGTQ